MLKIVFDIILILFINSYIWLILDLSNNSFLFFLKYLNKMLNRIKQYLFGELGMKISHLIKELEDMLASLSSS